MIAKILSFAAAQKLRDEDIKRGAYVSVRALEMLMNGVKPKKQEPHHG